MSYFTAAFFETAKGELPADGEYVLGHYTGGNWMSDDPGNRQNFILLRFHLGQDLGTPKVGSMRMTAYDMYDIGNNRRPYGWSYAHGHGTLFGQDVDFWCRIPTEDALPGYTKKGTK